MNLIRILGIFWILFIVGIDVSLPADAESSAAAQANNPLANITAFNIQNYYVSDLTDLDDETANHFFLRYAKPVTTGSGSTWLFRATLPYRQVPSPQGDVTGIGDIDAFAAYLFDTEDPGISFGAGPLLVAPTASEDETGSDKWQIGAAVVLFNAKSPKIQYGGLLTYQTDFAGDSDRDDVSIFAAQPFLFYQLNEGWYLRGAPIWAYNTKNSNYNIPLGAGIGKVWVRGKTVFNLFFEPQFSIDSKGPGQADTQYYMALNMQFR
jgi:hypothetical protein